MLRRKRARRGRRRHSTLGAHLHKDFLHTLFREQFGRRRIPFYDAQEFRRGRRLRRGALRGRRNLFESGPEKTWALQNLATTYSYFRSKIAHVLGWSNLVAIVRHNDSRQARRALAR